MVIIVFIIGYCVVVGYFKCNILCLKFFCLYFVFVWCIGVFIFLRGGVFFEIDVCLMFWGFS